MKNTNNKINKNQLFIYSVFSDINPEIENFCQKNNITYSTEDYRTVEFISSKTNLRKLHNKFFNEYEFEIYTQEEFNNLYNQDF
jgi:hypothetical protein